MQPGVDIEEGVNLIISEGCRIRSTEAERGDRERELNWEDFREQRRNAAGQALKAALWSKCVIQDVNPINPAGLTNTQSTDLTSGSTDIQ
jgi:hypothetical protein